VSCSDLSLGFNKVLEVPLCRFQCLSTWSNTCYYFKPVSARCSLSL